jgi:peptide chain release factor 2
MGETGFWDDPNEANRIVAEVKSLHARLDPLQRARQRLEDAQTLWRMAQEEDDDDARQEAAQEVLALEEEVDRLETASLLSGPYDDRNGYLSIYAREGGTEAQDWAEMLLRMYLRYIERVGWSASELHRVPGEEVGVKEVMIHVQGPFAFGYLSAERGTHRLARVSPFNAQGKRQTSFAAVEVTPEFEEANVQIDPKELEVVPFARSSGPGGQNVNKLATAVRMYHEPSGITVVCSRERSLEQNKRIAMSILQGKLEMLEQERRAQERQQAAGGRMEMGWGTQIRSYVFYDNRVKDHRTGEESGDPQRVLDGDLQPFLHAELQRRARAQHEESA